jgi:ubiquinone/menaquinone biosynthesis C-methylase UbiE
MQCQEWPNGSWPFSTLCVRTERMLMHVPDAEKALSEMARVPRRGRRMTVGLHFHHNCQLPVSRTYAASRALVTPCAAAASPILPRRIIAHA